jgi:carotenoid cleavage dioxygenase-like enzyme
MSVTRRAFLTSSTLGLASLTAGRMALGTDEDVPPDENLFLAGDFAPVREESTIDDLDVIGKLPNELNGFFVRNGPNPQFQPRNRYHLFEGDGMLHGVRLEDGKVSYRNRYVRTAAWNKEHEAGKALFPSILDPVDWKQLLQSSIAGVPPVPNRANTALIWHHRKLLALWEGGRPHEITLPALDTVGEYAFAGKLSHNFTAHPKIDPRTGELIFFGYQPIEPYLQHSVADRDGKITHTTAVPMPRPVMIHDAAITTNYTVILDAPALFDLTGAAQGQPFMKWQPENGTRIGVLPRYAAGDTIQWFEIDTCFVFHVFNAYEQGDEVVLHACRYPKFPTIVDFSGRSTTKNLSSLLEDSKAVAFTWRVNMQTGKVAESAMDDVGTEFPQIDQSRTGRPTRYGYCTGNTNIESLTFYKYDFQTGQRTSHNLGKGHVAGEAIFVPSENPQQEDDGYLVTLSYDHANERSELVVIPSRDFTSGPIARVIIPRRIPFGFHAAWIPATSAG